MGWEKWSARAFYRVLVRGWGWGSGGSALWDRRAVRKVGRVCTEACARSGRPRGGSPQRVVAVAARATASAASGAGKPAPSPAAPITSSCFCLAQRRSVCPNPQLLPGLDLLPPLPPLPRLPAGSAAAAAPLRYSSAVTRAGSGLRDGGGRRESTNEPGGPRGREPTEGG